VGSRDGFDSNCVRHHAFLFVPKVSVQKLNAGPACGQLMALLKKTPNLFVEALEQRIVMGSTQPWSVILTAGVSLSIMSPTLARVPTQDRLDAVLKSGELRVGITQDTPPLSISEPDGSVEGLDIDMLESLSKAMGVEIVLVKTNLAVLLDRLRKDKFDISLAGGSVTYDRAKVGAFSKPYMHIGKLLMIRATDTNKYKSLADLDKPGIKIAFNKGGLNDRFVNFNFKQAMPVGFASNALATPALLAGEVNAQVVDSTAGLYDVKQDSRLALIDLDHPIDPISSRFCSIRAISRCSISSTFGSIKLSWTARWRRFEQNGWEIDSVRPPRVPLTWPLTKKGRLLPSVILNPQGF
jgi:cyclohexadienyl dehydratase